MFNILEARDLAPGVRYVRIEAPKIARRRKAGQFVIIRATSDGERIPLTIADRSIEITAPTLSWVGIPTTIGFGLQTNSVRVRLSNPGHGGTTVRIESADPASILLSASETLAGQDFVEVFSGQVGPGHVEQGAPVTHRAMTDQQHHDGVRLRFARRFGEQLRERAENDLAARLRGALRRIAWRRFA